MTLPADADAPTARTPVTVVGDVLTGAPVTLLAVALLVVHVVANGLWVPPDIDTVLILVRDPLTDSGELGVLGYLVHSPLGPLGAHLLGLDTELGFALFSLVVLVGGAAAVLAVVHRRFGDLATRAALVALFCCPLFAAASVWLGLGDGITFVAGSFVVLASSAWAGVLAGAVLGFDHFEQGVVAILGVAIVTLGLRGPDVRRRIAAPVVGLLAGKLALLAYHRAFDIDADVDRIAVVRHQSNRILEFTASSAPVLALSLYNAAWILVIWLWLRARRDAPMVAWAFLAANAAFVVACALTVDQTRVFALVSWPALLLMLTWAARTIEPAAFVRALSWTLLAGLLLPVRIVVQAGRVLGSASSLLFGWLL